MGAEPRLGVSDPGPARRPWQPCCARTATLRACDGAPGSVHRLDPFSLISSHGARQAGEASLRALRVLLVVLLLFALAIGAFFLWARHSEIATIDPSRRPPADEAVVAKGAELAAIGDCDVCHTVPGGPPYAGGRPIPTPFGTIYSANITPDATTGISRWSQAAFRRAMKEGVSRNGDDLYPAFPYDHYTKLGDDDVAALYAFLMSRSAVQSRPPANALIFPLNLRWTVAVWDLLYLDRTPFRPDPKQSEAWNRGAYLVQGLGHCGDCHTPRDRLGGERTAAAFAGGTAEGWSAPALTAASPAPLPWSEAQLFRYLHQGWDTAHGAAAGPMAPVTRDLARASASDVAAIATYVATLEGPGAARPAAAAATANARPLPTETVSASPADLGATLFEGACANCHSGISPMVPPHGIDLRRSTAIGAPDPTDAIFIVLDGIRPVEGERGPWMPRFDGAFTDAQLAALLNYLRAQHSGTPPWSDLDSRIRALRQSKERS
ncbi:MAG TPA: cytochrome c [Stellaceae bacterium]|nr:cytochrome c [Stellaceae bacterium]